MTIPVERARSRRPITWLTILGVILLPAVIGGILVVALYNPTSRLDAISAAIVNEDEPVTIDGQYVPLGRQLTAGLVEGSDEIDSNISWTISNADDAAEGLADGTYAAVVTIPENFSAAATSTRPGETPEKATIEVSTPPDSLIVDDAITAQITSAAASLTGQELSSLYLENVFLGFTTLGDQLGEAADGADQLADGMRQSADGSAELASGLQDAASGASQLAGGMSQLSSGLSSWSAGATDAANGLNSWASGAGAVAGGSQQVTDGLNALAAQTAQIPAIPQSAVDAIDAAAANQVAIDAALTAAVDQLNSIAIDCPGSGLSPSQCASLIPIAAGADAALPTVQQVLVNSDEIAATVTQFQDAGPQLAAGVAELAGGSAQVTAGISGLAAGATDAAAGVQQLASGAGGLAAGSSEIASGTADLASGVEDAADGATALADGNAQLADGTTELADGLHTAATSLPSYTDAEAANLAEVVADPVQTQGLGSDLFGASAIPLLAALALWFGALGSFVVLRAIPARTLASRSPSALLALRSLAPAAAIGAIQGLLVAGIVQISAGYDWVDWSIFAGVSIVAGVSFAAVNQALNAILGGAGRWVSALVGVLAVATGIVSTVPAVLSSIAVLMPTSPAYNAMLGALTASGGVGAGLAGLIIWGGLAFGATVLAVIARRTTTARALLAAPTAG